MSPGHSPAAVMVSRPLTPPSHHLPAQPPSTLLRLFYVGRPAAGLRQVSLWLLSSALWRARLHACSSWWGRLLTRQHAVLAELSSLAVLHLLPIL